MADVRVLTAPGAELELPPDYRPLMCLYSDGRFLVAKTHLDAPYTRSLVARATRLLGLQVEKIPSDIETIRKAYEAAAGGPGGRKTAVDVTKMQKDVTELLVRGFQARASDIHIRVSKREHTSIWMRILGDLTFKEEHSFEYGERLCSTIYVAMTDVADTAFKPLERQDARIAGSEKLPAGLHGVRIATTPQVDGFVMVMRLLYNDTSSETLDLTALGYTATHAKAIQVMKSRPTGINIIAGPTGSGKSTTLQRIIVSYLKERQNRIHVITVEDPPEYPLKGAVQTPVVSDSPEGRSRAFSAAISAAMRLDPDTIMIGEVRDKSSARLAVQAAMTGHQVWTTVHANDGMGIMDRMIDLLRDTENPNPMDLIADPNIISGLICQRLSKVLCPHCKKKMLDEVNDLDPELVERVRKSVSNIENVYIRGEGCEKCNHAGVKGRSALAEVIAPDMQFMLMLKKGDKFGAADYWKTRMNGRTLVQHAISKIEDGIVDPVMAEETVGPLTLGESLGGDI